MREYYIMPWQSAKNVMLPAPVAFRAVSYIRGSGAVGFECGLQDSDEFW
jgi:hypothetical protein